MLHIKLYFYKSIDLIFRLSDFFNFKSIIKSFKRFLERIYTLWILHNLGSNNSNICIRRTSKFIGEKNIHIGPESIIENNCCIEAIEEYAGNKYNPIIKIGKNVHIGEYNHLTAINSIIIKDGVLTGRRVTISDNNHGSYDKKELNIKPSDRKLSSKGSVVIGENVWIGENVCILSGVKIGKGCIVAANAVVTKNIPEYCMIAGVPAKIIRKTDN